QASNPVVRSRRPSRRPDLRSLSTPRTAAVKHARTAPPKAARSVLDGREHGGTITAEGRRSPQARAVYTRVFTAANRRRRVGCETGSRIVPGPDRIVVHRSLWRLDVRPDLEVGHAHLWRQVK